MQVFSSLFNKFVAFIVFLLILGAGCVLTLRFLSPPPVQVPSSNPLPQPQSQQTPDSAPSEAATPSQNPSSPISQPTTSSEAPSTPSPGTNAPSPVATTTTTTSSDAPASKNSNSTALPALALPNQVALSAPKKLKPGAVLAIYENVDNNPRPDAINYSPTSRREVEGLTLTSVKQSEFQEVSGYFLAEKSGNYAFVITFPDNAYLDSTSLRLRIDGQPLSNVKGGTVNLEKGWHKVDLFYYEVNGNTANSIQVKWGLEGSDLKRLQVWREAT